MADAAARTERSSPMRYFMWAWMAFLTVSNVAGISNLISGLIEWHEYLQSLIDVYREARDFILVPIYNWIGIDVPQWVSDALVLWSTWFLAFNFALLEDGGKTFIGELWSIIKDFDFEDIGYLVSSFLFPPLLMLLYAKERMWGEVWFFGKYVIVIIIAVFLVLFINYQLTQQV